MLRAKKTLVWIFLMPAVFLYFIGVITGGSSGGSEQDSREWIVVLIPEDAGFFAEYLAIRLEQRDYRVYRPETEEAWRNASRQIGIPEGFTEAALQRHPVEVEFQGAGGAPSQSSFDKFRVQRAVYSELAAQEPTEQALAALAARPRQIQVEVVPAGEK